VRIYENIRQKKTGNEHKIVNIHVSDLMSNTYRQPQYSLARH